MEPKATQTKIGVMGEILSGNFFENSRKGNTMSSSVSAILESIRPVQSVAIMDVVEDAGIAISGWSVKQDGSPVSDPKKNPKYCYEWAFGGEDEPTLLCVWHKSLSPSDGEIEFQDSLRRHALGLDRVATERTNPPPVKSRARDQAKRARKFDSLLQRAFRKSRPVRVVLLLGEQRAEAELGWDTSKVRYRRLDSEPWYVHFYNDDDGSFKMVRGVPLVSESESEAAAAPEAEHYVDQFSIPVHPEKREAHGSAYVRSKDVRDTVLSRAKGKCEYCSEPGFAMDNGAVFLETHHVIPLSENGSDKVWNVVALCPDDHRRAHFSVERLEIRQRLLEKLQILYCQ